MFSFKKKVLFGLSVSLVLAMAIGSFAIGETQTPANTQLQTHSAVNAPDSGAFTVTATDGETVLTDNDYSYSGGILTIKSATPMTIKNTNTGSTTDRIKVEGAATITLAGVNIEATTGAALAITDNATFNVNITLADDSENTLTATSFGYAGLQKSDDGTVTNLGTLTITGNGKLEATGGTRATGIGGGGNGNGSDIKINGGNVTATGGYNGAGIGGGNGGSGSDIKINGGTVIANGTSGSAGIGGGQYGNGSDITISSGKVKAYGGMYAAGIGGGLVADGNNITISGGEVKAYGGKYFQTDAPSGIGGGRNGTSTGNSISSNAVVMATSGLAGVEALPNCTIDNGIVFKGYGDDFDTNYGRATDFDWIDGEMIGNVSLIQDVEIPYNLTIPDGQTLSIDQDPLDTKGEKTVTLSAKNGAKWTVKGELRNNWKVNLPSDLAFDDEGKGKVTTKTDFYRNGSTEVYKTGYQTYQTKAGVQKYKDLPNPDDTTLLKNSLNSDKFIYWYYLDKDGKEVAIKDGDAGDNVLPNQHKFYEKRATAYAVTIPTLENGSVTSDVTEAYLGDTVTLTVTPAEGYELQENSLKVMAGTTAVTATKGADGKYTFTMPNAAVTISAVFEQIPEPTPTPPGPEPTPTPPGPEPGPEPTPTPEPTPDPSVNPDGGDGSGASSKTSDPFMGGVALALLGVATTGAVLVRKRK